MPGIARRAQEWVRKAAIGVAALSLAVPTPAFAGATPADATHAAAADAYMVVDCLFPSQVRRLGAKMVVQGRRMAARVTARECEIRGGEYVAYDRASADSSIKVWAPLAEAGDPKAQMYMGDIHARGFGRAPDFAKAAQWYAKAANQSYGPAMFSLASLYETGAGVPLDKKTAAVWYRKAAGLDGPEFDRVAFGPAPEGAAQTVALKTELEGARSETARLREQIRTLQAAALTTQKDATTTAAALSAEKAKLAEERSALERERAALKAQSQSVARATTEVEGRLSAREAAALGAVQKAQSEADSKLAALAARETALKDRERQLDTRLTEERAALDGERKALEAQRAQLAADAKGLTERQSQADAGATAKAQKARAEAEAKLAALEKRERELAQREQSVKADEAKASARMAELTKLQAELDKRSETLVAQIPAGAAPIVPSAPPQIVLLDPEILPTRGQSVVIAAQDAATQLISGQVRAGRPLMSLTINGVAVRPTAAGVFGAQLPVSPTATDVRIVAVDDRGGRGELTFELRRAAPVAPLSVAAKARQVVQSAQIGKFHALLIGNSDYQRPGWTDLRTPRQDVTELGKVLSENYNFEVETLLDATREQIGSAIFRLRERIGENDNVLIYYAGHGTFQPGPVGDRGYWIPVDGDQGNPANWIASDNIHDWVGMLPARKVLVVSDSCFSGLLMRTNSAFLQAGLSEDAQLALLKNEAEGRSRTYFTSGRDAPVLDQGGVGGKHSVFAQAFIDSLRANDGIITGRALSAKVEQTVLYLSRIATKGTESQQPDYQQMRLAGHVAGDFIFVPRAG